MERVTITWSRINPSTGQVERERIEAQWIFEGMIEAARFFERVEGFARKLRSWAAGIDWGKEARQ
jgi:hypothetical protein